MGVYYKESVWGKVRKFWEKLPFMGDILPILGCFWENLALEGVILNVRPSVSQARQGFLVRIYTVQACWDLLVTVN